jgi:hypothetical protein
MESRMVCLQLSPSGSKRSDFLLKKIMSVRTGIDLGSKKAGSAALQCDVADLWTTTAAFSCSDQSRRRPAPVKTSTRRADGTDIGLWSDIVMCRSSRNPDYQCKGSNKEGGIKTAFTVLRVF